MTPLLNVGREPRGPPPHSSRIPPGQTADVNAQRNHAVVRCQQSLFTALRATIGLRHDFLLFEINSQTLETGAFETVGPDEIERVETNLFFSTSSRASRDVEQQHFRRSLSDDVDRPLVANGRSVTLC